VPESWNEDELLRSVAFQNANSILAARLRAEKELIDAKEALLSRERELSLIYDNVSDVIFNLGVEGDSQYRFLSVNPAFLLTTGLSREQVVGKLVKDIIPEPARSLVLDHYATAIRERRTVRWEETSEYPAGRKVGLVSVTPTFDAGGRCVNLIGTVHDITERKREEELRARLAAVVESSDDAVISKTLEGIITTWNRGAEQIFGYTAAEAIGKPITMLMPPGRVNEEPSILERLERGERIEHYETVRIHKDGTLMDISLSVSPIRESSGNLIGASKIARDITSRKKMEEALRDESRVLESLNRTGSLIASQLELEALVQSVTDAATQLTGARFGAFFYNVINEQGESFVLYSLSGAPREAFERFGLPRNTPVFEPTFRGQGIVRSADITKDPRYGTMLPHNGMPKGHLPVRSYLAVPVVSRSGEVIGGLFFGHPEVGVFTERAERIVGGMAAQAAVAIDNSRLYARVKRAAAEREQLLAAERAARANAERINLMKDEFLATLSHELRTPLNAILGWAHILRARKHESEEMTEGLSVIERNARMQTQLIEDLLDMSRIISGKIRLDVQQVDLQDAVKAAIASVQHSADAKGIRMQVVLDPAAGPVRGDPGRLQQCFWNLLSNAIKFTSRGGKVHVSLQRVNSHLEVCVADDGEGIKPEFMPYLFERFRQGDASTTRRHGGLGLGLSIVKSLVELHGGNVRASSPGQGKGATFCIELPLMTVQPTDDPRGQPQGVDAGAWGKLPSLVGISVLAVDDEPDARELIKYVLERCGAKVAVAASGREAIAMLRALRPDMIVSDIGMPDEDGYEFMRKVRLLPPESGGKTPAAALTAFARAEDRTRALLAGYQIHISKPVEPAELTAVVASLARRG
jgi:PAS domain S-box-containing protein